MPLVNPSKKRRNTTIVDFVDGIFGTDMHVKRVQSLACATLGFDYIIRFRENISLTDAKGEYYGHLRGMPEKDASALIQNFHKLLLEIGLFKKVLGII